MSELVIERVINSLVGGVEVIAGDAGLLQVNLFGKNSISAAIDSDADNNHPQALQIARQALQEIKEYLDKKRTIFHVLVDWSQITSFQKKVLEAACAIPFGEVRTYGQLAQQLGIPSASRAVGGALARNPMPIIIPCHRVVASNGNLTGFSAADGIQTKQWLLELEGRKIVSQKLV
ncbi:MAG: methylated-DNA-protein-cysteine S-methyltransferase [Chloroflexi bacterium]|nr:MAG: methylated-DNA-protein-cysteine S-methyltransferase [Chloroflexota bacterium]MBA4376874.1 hypothetical protein [Anaerolinea sp.]